jgi:Ca2+-binding RTX toxin-like protein
MASAPAELRFTFNDRDFILTRLGDGPNYELSPETDDAIAIDQTIVNAAQVHLFNSSPDLELDIQRVRGSPDDDRLDIRQSGGVYAAGGNDTVHVYATEGREQNYTFGGTGDDRIFLHFGAFAAGLPHSHGHHVRGDIDSALARGRDVFAFADLSRVEGVVVGRIEDFEATRDTLRIEGEVVDLVGGFSSGTFGGHQLRVVAYNGDLGDDSAQGTPQQWLLIETAAGGTVFYALEGARVDVARGGKEANFIDTLPDFATLPTVAFSDPVNYVPLDKDGNEHVPEEGGLFINDDDETYTDDADGKDVTTVISGTAFGDVIAAGLNSDTVEAHGGNDKVWGGTGHDTIDAGAGNDAVWGGRGNDLLLGGDGDDTLFGGAGDDTILGGAGNDVIHVFGSTGAAVGGAVADRFVFADGDEADTIADFEDGIDTLDLRDFSFASAADALARATETGGDVVFDFGKGDGLTVEDITLAALSDDILV